MKRIIATDKAPKAIGPYSQAVEINDTLYTSGQIPLDAITGEIVAGGITEQTEQVFKNLGTVLSAAGYSFSDVVKTTCMLNNMANFATFNEIYAKYFTANFPARSTFQAAALPRNVMVEVECIAVKAK